SSTLPPLSALHTLSLHDALPIFSAVGAAAPVLPTGEDLPATMRDKTISYWSALIRGSAVKNGHNPDVGEAFMNKDKEVKLGDRRSEEHTSELQSRFDLVCRLLLE